MAKTRKEIKEKVSLIRIAHTCPECWETTIRKASEPVPSKCPYCKTKGVFDDEQD